MIEKNLKSNGGGSVWKLDKSIVGQRFCSLTVLDEYVQEKCQNRRGSKTKWKVRCDCGNEFFVNRNALLRRKVMFCERCKPMGKRNTRLYHIYHGIKQRCFNKNCSGYEHYGGRGISICDEWLNSYESFQKWSLENGYKERVGLSIDRIDNDGNYCPENCQWITIGENSAKSNIGKQQVFSKLDYIYAISPDGDRVDITNIAKFSRDHDLNKPCVYAAIHGRMPSKYGGWEFHSPKSRL